jgi:hypothetical protein
MPIRILTSQAPDAKPVGVSINITQNWRPVLWVPEYEVPEQVFGGSYVVVPGTAEVISPFLIVNTSDVLSARVSIRIFRAVHEGNPLEQNTYFTIANNIPIARNDMLALPLNGQFFLTGDLLEVKADVDGVLVGSISFTVGQAEQDDVV